MQVKHTGRRPLKPWRVRRVRTASGPFHWTNPQSPRPGFMWFAVRSKSDPSSIPQVAPKPGKLGKNLPLKSSMKRKAKSATTTPPSEIHTDSSTLTDEQKLRRVKTVDFEETTSKGLSSLPPLKLWSSEPTSDAADGEQRPRTRTPKAYVEPVKAAKRAPSCPGPMVKSSLADPAVTRTDVHVVAIAPSWSFDDTADEGGIDPATPTMQIVESKNGCYEVIWDDVPEEHDIRLHRRSSSASQALHTFGSTASRGLERVNTKLTEWTWGREGPTQPFKPQIVVFPDDDDRSPQPPQPDCAVDDSGDLVIVPPPNSAMTSTNPSRHTSRPVSTRTSREGSYDDPVQTAAPNINHPHDKRYSKIEPILRTSAIPDPDATMRTLTGVGRRVKGPPADRRLSNMDESEMRFRGHRDSVTIARTRMFDVGGISPELFMHRDSVAIAKKRMHGRSHAVSDVRDILRSKVKRSELLSTIEDVPQQSRSPSPIPAKEYATKALKSSGSASTLHLHAPTTQRHIRIAD
ncbi:hypothetical protein BU26DRAFT_522847 [Trematosphaeria pertusa]|uniref:Uncharacterized protein n=1 Tax=Trematosphaeria pertusa TaxID=390896 RepID=A0A6A6I0W9_9PLEO|nr:uncharacterized protein BU26DRAFT_522847 [Trematosphaeria pertusa]KAF2244144.1 hypothetical protein BU26DRAFT_522847 [Trematosphaeria pertusa]